MLRSVALKKRRRSSSVPKLKKILIFGGITILIIIVYISTFYAQMKVCVRGRAARQYDNAL